MDGFLRLRQGKKKCGNIIPLIYWQMEQEDGLVQNYTLRKGAYIDNLIAGNGAMYYERKNKAEYQQ